MPQVDTAEADEAVDPLECAVREAFAAVLGLAGVHREANFFELGGDSLLAVRVATALRPRPRDHPCPRGPCSGPRPSQRWPR